MYRILLPVGTDGEEALRTAEHVVTMPIPDGEFTVTILNVFREFEGVEGEMKVSSTDFYDESAFPESVTAVREYLESNGRSPDVVRRHGDPAEEIVEAAQEIGSDLLVVGGRKRSPVGKMVFGSVVQEVLLTSGHPVTVVME